MEFVIGSNSFGFVLLSLFWDLLAPADWNPIRFELCVVGVRSLLKGVR